MSEKVIIRDNFDKHTYVGFHCKVSMFLCCYAVSSCSNRYDLQYRLHKSYYGLHGIAHSKKNITHISNRVYLTQYMLQSRIDSLVGKK